MRNVIVTGGSRGLGLAICRKLTTLGYRAIAIARTENEQLASVMREAEQSHPESLRFVPFDLGEVQDIPDLVRRLRRDYGRIYGLVNNAAAGLDGVLSTMHNSQSSGLYVLIRCRPSS
jgi:3-oxoacyl-[acyl-carrier protein] reductase